MFATEVLVTHVASARDSLGHLGLAVGHQAAYLWGRHDVGGRWVLEGGTVVLAVRSVDVKGAPVGPGGGFRDGVCRGQWSRDAVGRKVAGREV